MNLDEMIRIAKSEDGQINLIRCKPWDMFGSGVLSRCEACNAPVSAFPVSVSKIKEDTTFHIVCVDCFGEIVHRVGPAPFGGRIESNRWPEKNP